VQIFLYCLFGIHGHCEIAGFKTSNIDNADLFITDIFLKTKQPAEQTVGYV